MEARPLLELLEVAQERERLAERDKVLSETSGTLLRQARQAAGVSTSVLSEAVGVSSSYIRMVENGQKSVSSESLLRFHEAIVAHASTSSTGEVNGKGKQDGNRRRKASARR